MGLNTEQMGNQTVTSHVISSVRETQADFDARFKNDRSEVSADQRYITETPFRLFVGKYEGDPENSEKNYSQPGGIRINYATMSDLPLDGVKDSDKKVMNDLIAKGELEGAPVTYDAVKSGLQTTIKINVDLEAFNVLEYNLRKNALEKKNFEPAMSKSAGRVPINLSFISAKNGVPAMSPEIMAANVGKYEVQRTLLFNGKEGPKLKLGNASVAYGQKEIIQAANEMGKEIYDSYNAAIKDINSGKAAKGLKSVDKTTGKAGAVIDGTAVAVDKYCFTTKEVEGVGTVYAIGDAKTGKPLTAENAKNKEVVEWLKNANSYINKKMAQEANKKYQEAAKTDVVANLKLKGLNEINIRSYAVDLKKSDPTAPNIAIVQPSMAAKMTPFISAVYTSNMVATHGEVPVFKNRQQVGTRVAQPADYGKTLEVAEKLYDNFYKESDGADKSAGFAATKAAFKATPNADKLKSAAKKSAEKETPAKEEQLGD